MISRAEVQEFATAERLSNQFVAILQEGGFYELVAIPEHVTATGGHHPRFDAIDESDFKIAFVIKQSNSTYVSPLHGSARGNQHLLGIRLAVKDYLEQRHKTLRKVA